MTSHIEGMTVNERLYHFNLMENFEEAIHQKDKEKAISILQKAKLTVKQSKETVSQLFQNLAID